MRDRPDGRMLGLSGTLLVLFLAVNGCHSTPSLPKPDAGAPPPSAKESALPRKFRMQPGMEVAWAFQSTGDHVGLVQAGTAFVGPDGTMPMGPYGSCKVAGLTFEQASKQAEKQLASYVSQPRVTLRAVTSNAPQMIAWKKASYPPANANQIDLASATKQDGPIRPIAFDPTVKDDAKILPLPVVKDQDPAPPLVKHTVNHHGKAPPPLMPPPNAPNEMNPVLLPPYIIRPPDVLLIDSQKGLLTQPIRGQHLVRPDGTVGIGIYGPVVVAGKTIQQAREDLARVIHAKLDPKQVKFDDVLEGLSVDVLAFNSSVYYVITDGAGLGEQVYRFPVIGSETVLDAISHINGLPVVSSPRRIWVARRNPGHGAPESIFPVDWKGISQMGAMNTNWQIMPGDRIYVQADPVRRFNNNLSKFLEPVERVLGATLLGAQTRNAINGVVSR